MPLQEENEKLRGLLRESIGQIDLLIEAYVEDDVEPEDIAISEQIKADIQAALSRQTEQQPEQSGPDLKAILEDVEREYGMGGLSDGLYADYASDVAKRYAAVLSTQEK